MHCHEGTLPQVSSSILASLAVGVCSELVLKWCLQLLRREKQYPTARRRVCSATLGIHVHLDGSTACASVEERRVLRSRSELVQTEHKSITTKSPCLGETVHLDRDLRGFWGWWEKREEIKERISIVLPAGGPDASLRG